MNRALEVMTFTLSVRLNLRFGYSCIHVHYFLANKVNQACEGPQKLRVFSVEKHRPKTNITADL